MKHKMFLFIFLPLGSIFATLPFGRYILKEPIEIKKIEKNPLKKRYNYLYEFSEIASFLANWQLDVPDSADYGGIIEAESGSLRDVIQTDNTLEAIWVWSTYALLTKDTERFKENIEKAWIYVTNYPAWKEEGEPGNDYYRVHNSAWGIAAERAYREAYEDESYTWYRDSCAEYISTHYLNIYHPVKTWKYINAFCQGWAAGWLYKEAKETNDSSHLDSALVFGERLIEWVEENPDTNLSEERWAMSSGTVVWGVCNTVFQEDPEYGKSWIEDYGEKVDTFQEYRSIPWDYGWDNSWNIAYANAHHAMYEISKDTQYARHHKWLTHLLLSYDMDGDGGIPASTQDSCDEDMTWISAYLCLKGLFPLIGTPLESDAGILEFVGIEDSSWFSPQDTLDVKIVVSNFGLEKTEEFSIIVSGVLKDTVFTSLDFLETDTLEIGQVELKEGRFKLSAQIHWNQDENPQNDTLSLTIFVGSGGITEKPIPRVVFIETKERFEEFQIFDISGRRLKSKTELPKGVYFGLKKGKVFKLIKAN